MKKLIVLAVVILGFTATSFAQTLTTNSKAVIVSSLTFAKGNDMDFGSLLSTAAAQTAVLTDDASGTISGVTKGSGGSTPKAAMFTITGAGGSPIVTFPSSASLVATSGGTGTPMALTIKCKAVGGSGDIASGSTVSFTNGSAVIYIGGSLALAANQTAGTYQSSDFNVSVNY